MKLALALLAFLPSLGAADPCGVSSGDAGLAEDLAEIPREARPAKVYYGTPRPTQVPLTEGMVLAIGSWGTCSGTVVAPGWVLTANHCTIRVGQRFCIGDDADKPLACTQAAEVHRNPDADMTLVRLSRDLAELVPALVPIPPLAEDLGPAWIGTIAEAAGYGQQETGAYGEREFTAEPIVDLDGHELTVDGEGRHGVCFGDSGGPVMVVDSQGRSRVAGALSWGDPDCLGRDRYTRVDTNRAWLEGFLGPLADLEPVEPDGEPDGEPVGEPDGEPDGEPVGEPVGEPDGVSEDDPEDQPDYTTGEGLWIPVGSP
jgi:hypothetical protein